jgi:cyclopropane-fatty-acyl-phospholipid synthase
MTLRRPEAFFRRMGTGGLIGFGEAYMAGEWDSPDLTSLLTVFADHVSDLIPPRLQRLRRIAVRRQPAADDPTPDGARQNIHRHYDLSNELFSLFLDDTMTYSAALFGTGPDGAPIATDGLLIQAQHRKIDQLLDRAGVGPGTRLLEIGTGWGELAIRAASRGAHVVSVTISPEQQVLATGRIAAAGFADRVRVELRDYREVKGQFDAIVSCEMIEAVGVRYWPSYFGKIRDCLTSGGVALLQAITIDESRFATYRTRPDFIQRYIFPGGVLPTVSIIEQEAARAGLKLVHHEEFSDSYVKTLREWRDRFLRAWPKIEPLGFNDRFRRMWEYYLAYCEVGFRNGSINVGFFKLAG